MQVSRDEILAQIRSIATTDGAAPGSQRFHKITGLNKNDWYGRYWARWGDAVEEAGLSANSFQAVFDKNAILIAYIDLIKQLGKIPTEGELRLAKRSKSDFPAHSTFAVHMGLKKQRLQTALDFVVSTTNDPEIIVLLTDAISLLPSDTTTEVEAIFSDERFATGFVYLIRSGKFYKIGKTNSIDRRQYEIGLQLAEALQPIHSIETDDPSGIEAYWHNRFKGKRLNGEWFDLDASDIRAFKLRRKFM
jgi:Meiotically up-regulated gene 113